MKLSLKHPLPTKACSLVAATMALAIMAASSAAADQVKVFNQKVSGVPVANLEVITDNVFSPEFAPGLVAEGMNLLENPSGVITRFGNAVLGAWAHAKSLRAHLLWVVQCRSSAFSCAYDCRDRVSAD